MNDNVNNMLNQGLNTVTAALEPFMAAAQPGAVFSEPVVSGDFTVITACEVAGGGAFGTGGGTAPASDQSVDQAVMQQGMGGGGGAGSVGRPVAVIVIGPSGVEVKPVIDASKLGLAGISAWLGILGGLFQVLRARRR